MHISMITVCVNYSDYFSRSIKAWASGCENILVVTSPRDDLTKALCREHGISFYQTDAFYRDGAKFNKGRAIAEAYELLLPGDWVVLADSDLIPPEDWRACIEKAGVQPGCLYGAWRYEEGGKRIPDPDICGWFHMAHISDPNMLVRPIVDIQWSHAGCYDTQFQDRWKKRERSVLPIRLTHLGETWSNWAGRGNNAAMKEIMDERVRRRGWSHEVIEIHAAATGLDPRRD